MWIMTNEGFVSIARKDCPQGHLLLKAHRREHLARLFPDAEIEVGREDGYAFRAVIPEDEVSRVIAERLRGIDYDNFKFSVEDDRLRDAYMDVCFAMRPLSD
jgi:hypothetical protein